MIDCKDYLDECNEYVFCGYCSEYVLIVSIGIINMMCKCVCGICLINMMWVMLVMIFN